MIYFFCGSQDYIDNFNNPQNNTSGHYDLFIQKGCSDSTVVTVYNAGEIKIGDKETANNTANLHIMDSARLVLTSNGLLEINEDSKVHVNKGGILTIGQDGRLKAGYKAAVHVNDGGLLHIKSKGILNLTNNAEVIVEEGGTLIVEPGAIFRLQDGPLDVDGKCRVVIKKGGKLIFKGPWKHEGNGYVQFDKDHILKLENDFVVRGIDKGIRFMRLNQGCRLQIDYGRHLILGLGKVDYEPSSAIELDWFHSEVSLDSLVCQGTIDQVPNFSNDATAIQASCKSINIYFSDILQMENGIKQSVQSGKFGSANGESFSMKRSTTSNVHYPLILSGMRTISMDSVILNQGIYSEFKECLRADLKRVRVFNMSQAGIKLNDSKYLITYNSHFASNSIGINASNKSNVFCYETNFMGNSSSGIRMEGTGEDGLVELGCCVFQNNLVCVNGKDILFSLNPESINPLLGSYGVPGNNRFLITPPQKYFNIQYALRYVWEVDARYNYWGGSAPSPSDYSIKYFSHDVPLNSDPYHSILINCMPQVPPNNGGLCQLTGNETGESFNKILGNAMKEFHLGGIETVEHQMKEISNNQQDQYWASNSECRFAFDYARVFTGEILLPNQEPVISAQSEPNLSDPTFVTPNPFSDFLMISDLSVSNVWLTVVNMFGIEIIKLNQLDCKSNLEIYTGDWPIGVYTIQYVNNEGIKQKHRIVKVSN